MRTKMPWRCGSDGILLLLLLVVWFHQPHVSSYIPQGYLSSLPLRNRVRTSASLGATKEDDDWDWDSVSDAEALLACRSYLQKTHQLEDGWRQRRRRNEMFFWEPPSALRYFQPPRRMTSNETMEEDASLQPIPGTRYFVQTAARVAEDEGEPEEEDDSVVAEVALLTLPSTPSSASSIEDAAPDSADSVWDLDDDPFTEDASATTTTVFSSTLSLHRLYSDDETTAALRHQRRSQAARQRFDNPTWKAAWYQRRWGDRPRPKASKVMDPRARRIPASFLAQLAVLSEAQLAAAMRQYRHANRRRARHRRRTNQRRRQFLMTIPSPTTANLTTSRFHYHDDDDLQTTSDTEASRPKTKKVFSSFLVPTSPQPNPALQAERERRAAQAQRAYQQRVPPNAPSKSLLTTTKVRRPVPGSTLTPAEALRITEQLLLQQQNKLYQSPELLSQLLQLVQIVLVPTKLAHRQAILCRIVQQVFGLRGKCIPVHSCDGTTYQFLTKASVPALGAFLMERIRQRLQELAANQSDPVM